MKGLTHVFFGVGLVSAILAYLQVPIGLWGIGTFILAPIFSRLPDFDQKIAKITFNQLIPHRGILSHNFLYGLPIFLCFYVSDIPILLVALISVFGALFLHVFVDAFNSGGVWFGFFHLSFVNFRWDSFWGNSIFKLVGIGLLGISILVYI
ncbi:hypothetical protein CEE45_07995 [Candidatus Heimdallarchaeota archaeon B3_Heim]|nr:MAG: hypothetical protein CEE45_07995 [Candidatus Heimdallarchaeota archaeon B3_Heim]